MFKSFTAAFAAPVLALGLAMASPAAAATSYYVSDASWLPGLDMDNAQGYGAYTPDMPYEAVYMTPYLVTANEGTSFNASSSVTFLAFCLDPFTSLRPGPVDDGGDPNYEKADGDNELVGRLINYGTSIYQQPGATDFVRLTAIQGAIWQVLYPHYTFSAYSGNIDAAAVNLLIGDYKVGANLPTSPVSYKTLLATDGLSQAIGVAIAVPEPGMWLIMIVGFFGLGYRLRRSARHGTASV